MNDSPAPAIGHAIYDAIGVRMARLPMNPEAVMAATWKNEN